MAYLSCSSPSYVDGAASTTQLSMASLPSIPMTLTSPWDRDRALFDESLNDAYKTSTFIRSAGCMNKCMCTCLKLECRVHLENKKHRGV